jgi:hypothetical protein
MKPASPLDDPRRSRPHISWVFGTWTGIPYGSVVTSPGLGRLLKPLPGLPGVAVFQQDPEVVHGAGVAGLGRFLPPVAGPPGVAVPERDP